MTRFFACISVVLCILVAARIEYSFQGGGGEEKKDNKDKKSAGSKTSTKGEAKGGATKKPTSPAPPVIGDFTIVTTPPACEVLLDGESRGSTNTEGFLTLTKLRPGRYSITLRKPAYRDYKTGIDVIAGQKSEGRFSLSPLPGKLSVSSTPGSQISISGVGSYYGTVTGLELAPGRYEILIAKTGFHTASRSIAIEPEKSASLNIPLEPFSSAETLSQAENDFNGQRFAAVIQSREPLQAIKTNPGRIRYMIGASYYKTGNYDLALNYLISAVQFGENITIGVTHTHRGDKGAGNLVLQKDAFVFNGGVPKENFSVPYNKIVELKRDYGLIHLKVSVPKGNKEDQANYTFYFNDIATFPQGDTAIIPSKSWTEIDAIAIVQLIARVKQGGPNPVPVQGPGPIKPTLKRIGTAEANPSGGLSAEALTQRSVEHSKADEFPEAEADLRRALKAEPRSSLAHYNLGLLYMIERNYQKAIDAFGDAIDGNLSPAWIEAWSYLKRGNCYDALGQRERALAEYDKVITNGDNYNNVQQEAARYKSTPYTRGQ